MNTTKKITSFETGRTYFGRFIGDADAKFEITIIRRTVSSVWIKDLHTGEIVRKKIVLEFGQAEYIFPFGRYSMAPVLTADKRVIEEPDSLQLGKEAIEAQMIDELG